MKLAKALKLKNQLAGEVADLKELLLKQNSRPSKQQFDYNTKEVLAKLQCKTDELVQVKAAIATANDAVYNKIFRLAEIKGLVAVLTSLNTKAGVFHESSGLGGADHEIEYVAQISRVEADSLADELKKEIQTIQDELDEYNFMKTVNL